MHHPIELVRVNSLDQVNILAALGSQIWLDDPVFDLFSPSRHTSPKNYQQVWRLILNDEFSQPGTIILAACKGRSGDIRNAVGFAIWRRHGKDDTARSWQGDSLRKKSRRLAATLGLIACILLGRLPLSGVIELLLANRDVEKLYPAERWRLSWLGVSPDFQNCGIGKKLLRWGIERSEEEDVPVVLESSKSGRGLYEKTGFRIIGWQKFNGGKLQQPVMLREARGYRKIV